jgi:diguanylate cyclase (GGDEF)-like protein
MSDFKFYSLNLEKFGEDNDVHRRVYIIHFTMSLAIIFLLFLGSVALYEKNIPLAVTDYLIALMVILNLVYLHNTKRIEVSILLGITMTACFFFWLLIYGGVGRTAFVWYYTFPLYSVFVLGPKRGTIMAVLLIMAAVIFFAVDKHFPTLAQYPMDFKIRFVPSYLIVALFSYLSENFRDRTQIKLKTAYDTMELKVQERTAELQEKNEQLQIVSQTDALTGLKNRMKLDEMLQYEIAMAERYPERKFCIILMDLDHFKNVNDTYGHIAGDQVLVRFAAVLKKNTRTTDTLGRWGGEEFLMICPSMDIDNIYMLSEKLRRAISEEVFPIVERLTTSVGVTCYKKGDNINSIVKRADKALYKAKEERNICCVCSED